MKNNFLEKFSRNVKSSSIPARKSVTGVDANHLMLWCFLHSLLLFCCCTIECERGVLELDLLAMWQDSRWRCEGYNLHNVFSFKSFHICSINQKISELIKLLQSLNENSSWSLLCHQKYSRKCNRFPIMIINKLHDWCHWRMWTEMMYKARQTFCLDLFLLVA